MAVKYREHDQGQHTEERQQRQRRQQKQINLGVNAAIDHAMQAGMLRGDLPTWDRVLLLILSEFDNQPDDLILTVAPAQEDRGMVNGLPSFKHEMRLPLGYLRSIARDLGTG